MNCIYLSNLNTGMKQISLLFLLALLLLGSACKKSETPAQVEVQLDQGVFMVNQGTFTAGNASLAFYEPGSRNLFKDLFWQVNAIPLGDVAQSVAIDKNRAWVVVNNSGVIHAVDRGNAKLTGSISGLPSPRHMLIISENKAYVSDFFSRKISVVNPATYQLVKEIGTQGRSTEEMVLVGKKVFAANWSGFNQALLNNKILVFDTESDQIVDSVAVGVEPNSMVVDRDGYIWVLCTGGFEYSTKEKASLWRIDPVSVETTDTLTFAELPSYPSGLETGPSQDTLYFLDKGIFKMSIDSKEIPEDPFIMEDNGRVFGFLAVDPGSGDIYASDPLDYISKGNVYHYAASGKLLNTLLEVGIVPAAFGFSD